MCTVDVVASDVGPSAVSLHVGVCEVSGKVMVPMATLRNRHAAAPVLLTDVENHCYAVALGNHNSNFRELHNIVFWRNLRSYFLRVVFPINYGLSQWMFAAVFLFTGLMLLGQVLRVMRNGIEVLEGYGPLVFLASVFSYTGILLAVMGQSAAIWAAQMGHVNMLKKEIWALRVGWGVCSHAV
jgi:hypothetical protein